MKTGSRVRWAVGAVAGVLSMAAVVMGAEWSGRTEAFRVDGGAESGKVSEVREGEWAVWDASWDGAERVKVTLERPGGAVEVLGEGSGRGCAEWAPGEGEWGTFTVRYTALAGDGGEVGSSEARRARWRPEERAYGAWLGERGHAVEAFPPEGNADGDGAGNWEEYVADTDPADGTEELRSLVVVGEGGTVRVVPSVVSTGRVYGVRVVRDLREGDAREVGEWVELGPGREGIGAELGGVGEGAGFGVVGVAVP